MKKVKFSFMMTLSLVTLLITSSLVFGDTNLKEIKPIKSKIIVVNSLKEVDKTEVNLGDIIEVDETSKQKYGNYTVDDIVATYEESGIIFTSYSNSFSTAASLQEVHDELMKNEHYKEMNKLSKITIYPDGPNGILGDTSHHYSNSVLYIDGEVVFIPYKYNNDIEIEIYNADLDSHNELSEVIPTLSHEYGRLFTFNYMVEGRHQTGDSIINDYVKIRGLEGNSELRNDNSNGLKWNVEEIMSDDYRLLFGSEENAKPHINQEIPDILSEPIYSEIIGFFNKTLIKNGDGTEANPYLIETLYQLTQIDVYDDNGHYKLTKDFDLNDYDAFFVTDDCNWLPLRIFKGVLDGDGHIISNLKLGRGVEDIDQEYGFFRHIDGEVKNLGLINVNVRGSYNVAALTGYLNHGTISNCYVDGEVKGLDTVGGLVGYNWGGQISNNLSYVDINGSDEYKTDATRVGGIAGLNQGGVISKNLSNAYVRGYDDLGGIVGYNDEAGTISNNLLNGSIYAHKGEPLNTYRIVGKNDGILKNNYASESIDLPDYGPRDSNLNSKDGLDVLRTNLFLQSTYESFGWDFTKDWMIVSPGTKPFLRGFSISDEYIYNGDGTIKNRIIYINNVVKFIEFYENSIISHKEEYDEQGNKIAIYYYEKENNNYYCKYIYYYGNDNKLDYKLLYTYNAFQDPRNFYYKPESKEKRYHYKYVYDDGKLLYKEEYNGYNIRYKYTYYKDDDGKLRYKYKYEYDGITGKLLRKYEYYDGKKIAKYTYYIDGEGNYRYKFKYVYNNYSSSSSRRYMYKYEYYDGKIISKYTYYISEYGENRYKYKEVYDDSGELLYKYKYKHVFNPINRDLICYYRYVYDPSGNLLYKNQYENSKKVAKYTYYIDNNGKYRYKYKYEYDGNGDLLYKTEYYEGKKVVKYKYYIDDKGEYRYKYKYIYNENGSLSHKYEYYEGKKIYKYTYYIDGNGKYRYKYKYVYNEDGTGFIKRYTYKDGKIIAEETYN